MGLLGTAAEEPIEDTHLRTFANVRTCVACSRTPICSRRSSVKYSLPFDTACDAPSFLRAMTQPTPPRIPLVQLALLAIFGGFAFVYATKAINGTADTLDWVTLAVSVFLLTITAYRVLRDFGKP